MGEERQEGYNELTSEPSVKGMHVCLETFTCEVIIWDTSWR